MLRTVLRQIFLLIIVCINLTPAHATSEVFILFESQEKSIAEKWLKRFLNRKVEISMAHSFPQVVDNAKAPRLKKKSWIVVAGYCPSNTANDSILIKATLQRLMRVASGSHTKPMLHDTNKKLCPLVEKAISIQSLTLQEDLLNRAQEYNENMDMENLEYLTRYLLMLNPKNKTALDYLQKIMVLSTD